jgi:hypothetical protein
MPATKTRKSKSPSLLEVIAEHEKSKKRKRRTPARIYTRALVKRMGARNKKAWPLLVVPVALWFAAYHFLGRGALAVTVGLVAFLVLCEAWPEIARWAFQQRRMLTPFVALAFMVVPELAVYAWPRPTLMAALAGLVFVAYAHFNLWLRRLDHSHAAGYIPRQWLPMAYLATGWTILAVRVGLGRTSLAILLIGWLTWAGWFWFENRTRTSHQLPLAKRWAETIANADPDYKDLDAKDRLVGSRLTNVRSVPGGAAATVVLPPGQRGSKVDALVEVIASVMGVDVTAVTVDASTAANRRELFVLPKAATNKAIKWKGPDLDLAKWVSTIGTYIDGARVEYVWREWHDLISGTTGSGKSRLLDLLLATSRASGGLIVDWVLDPQNGQSLPDWQEEVDWFASGVDEGMRMLRAARSLMYARNRTLAKQEWVDGRGRTRKGVKAFTPTPDMPLLVLTIEEAHAVLNDDEAKTIVEDIAKMGRKCGIKVRLVTQVPTLSQLGNSNVLRSMVASGNVIVLRTGNKSDGQFAFQGAMQVDPVSIPRRMPDGSSSAGLGFALGAESRQAPMRTDFVEDPLDHAHGPVWRLASDEASSAGKDYTRRNRTDSDEDIIDVDVISETRGPAPAEDVVVRGPGGITCADRTIELVKAAANRADDPHARVSRSTVAAQLQPTWKLQNITKTIKELCEDSSRPVWSDDQRTTLYYKEAS